MATPDRLVTLDNNILIDLRRNIDPVATYASRLLDFNREGKIVVATTISTMLERQPMGEEMSVQELLAWLVEIGIASEHNFKGPRTVAFNVQGVFTFGVDRELALNECLHHAMFPQIPFYWRDYLNQECAKRGIEGTRREVLFEIDNKKSPYIPSSPQSPQQYPTPLTRRAVATSKPTLIPTPTFDPGQGAVLPTHRVVAFYAVPYAEPTGPAYEPTDTMLAALRQQGGAYEQLDPEHPVQLGIDLVVSVPDAFPGPQQSYSHHVDAGTIQSYIDFCSKNNLILFLDLDFGQSPIMDEVNFFLPYLEKYTFVHMAIDPEWMFPRRDGIPGINLSNVRASDFNPIIEAVAAIPMQYHVPRKMLIIHQYRPDGDGLKDPYDPGQTEIADKHNLLYDPRVDVVIHIDSVGGYSGDIHDKTLQYSEWVQQDMEKYRNFFYGGFKLFYQHEARVRLMTPKEVLSLDPPPMVVTYGN